jgi:hypothetical protein
MSDYNDMMKRWREGKNDYANKFQKGARRNPMDSEKDNEESEEEKRKRAKKEAEKNFFKKHTQPIVEDEE